MHALDNPIWHALTGPHATLAERRGGAARYDPEVAVFAAVTDRPDADAWDGLRDLVGPGGAAFLARSEVREPPGWSVPFVSGCRQMWLPPERPIGGHERAAGARAAAPVTALGRGDVAEMLALVERTRPGPFLARTIELGRYVGVREHGALVAMAGERMHLPGYTEVSAVCTEAAHRGRGLASLLVAAVVEGIRARGETPFLHLTLENEEAHRVYRTLGFETRTLLDVVGLQAPA